MSHFETAAERFIEQMGLGAEEDRLPRIAGRIWGLLVLEGGPLSIETIAERLGVSRASVSTNARRLESLHFAAKVSMPGDRRDYFELVQHPEPEQIRPLVERYRSREQSIRGMATIADPHHAAAAGRLRDLARFFGALADGIEKVSDQLLEWEASTRQAP